MGNHSPKANKTNKMKGFILIMCAISLGCGVSKTINNDKFRSSKTIEKLKDTSIFVGKDSSIYVYKINSNNGKFNLSPLLNIGSKNLISNIHIDTANNLLHLKIIKDTTTIKIIYKDVYKIDSIFEKITVEKITNKLNKFQGFMYTLGFSFFIIVVLFLGYFTFKIVRKFI